ncbi:hypothetical protein C5B94_03825 [Clavibacter michiganensis]|nr:hypothetical protein C5B94_03825 [Clavibacter michiganensis]
MERAQGVTATEIRDLYLKGKSYIPTLIAKKLGGPEPELNNRYVNRGREREPFLVAQITEQHPDMAHESRVFHAAANSRHLGSPDALGYVGGVLAVGEVKTGKDDIRGGMPDYYRKGYHLQQQWCMHVTGARMSVYVGERQDWSQGDPQPVDLFNDLYVEHYDPALVAQLVSIADEFLAAFDDAAAGGVAEFDEVLDTHAVNYLRGLDLEKQGAALKKEAFAAVKKALADETTFSQASPLARITWTRAGQKTEQRPVETVDLDAAKAAHPDEYAYLQAKRAEFEAIELGLDEAQEAWNAVLAEHTTETRKTVQVTVRENLTITAPKTMKETKK